MPKPLVDVPLKAFYEYETGQLTFSQIVKKYGINKTTLHRKFKNGNTFPNEELIKSMQKVNEALDHMDNYLLEKKAIEANGGRLELPPSLVCQEAVNIIKKRNPYFADLFQKISDKMLQRANEILETEDTTMQDLKDLSITIKNTNDTLQAIPKPPAIAQQFNFDNKRKEKEEKIDREIIVDIDFQ